MQFYANPLKQNSSKKNLEIFFSTLHSIIQLEINSDFQVREREIAQILKSEKKLERLLLLSDDPIYRKARIFYTKVLGKKSYSNIIVEYLVTQ